MMFVTFSADDISRLAKFNARIYLTGDSYDGEIYYRVSVVLPDGDTVCQSDEFLSVGQCIDDILTVMEVSNG